MNKIISSVISICLYVFVNAQTNPLPDQIVYGQCAVSDLKQMEWWGKGYDQYVPDVAVVQALRKMSFKDISIEVFFGSWCGDSKRELPHFDKILSAISFPGKQLTLVGLGGNDSLYKQSPRHEEAGVGIFRVPVFIVFKQGKEIGRINEFPVYSLEKDLLAILSGSPYTPNYNSFGYIHRWMSDGTLLDKNANERGLANIIRPFLENEYILYSLGNLLLKQDKKQEALRIFKINYLLYPEEAIAVTGLGRGLFENGDIKKAAEYLEYALTMNKKPENVPEILSVLYRVKGLKPE